MLGATWLTLFTLLAVHASAATIPRKIYGVNLGSWLLLEPWMLPKEWVAMGGQHCSDCSQCIASEFAYAQAYPKTVDSAFQTHWSTWFTQADVNTFVKAGLNTVRIPLGYWIVEPLVNRKTEFYPRGGIKQLQRGLQQLKNAGITAILDHHALPGVQTAGQMFAGRCTSDVEFYTDYNYHRALIWTAVMTSLAHLDPAFSTVWAIEAVNEEIMDATQTPGYGDFQKNFVQVVRAVELALGIPVPHMPAAPVAPGANFTLALKSVANTNVFNAEVRSVLLDAVPVLGWAIWELSLGPAFSTHLGGQRTSLWTNFMDVNWQYNNPANPADAAIGPQVYDNHLYYNFGGVADPTPEAYLTSICNLPRIANDAALGNSPLYFGEWAITTNFNATDEFMVQWGDAQRLAYSKGAGWIYWNFKTEQYDADGNDLARQWSYEEALRRGYMLWDPTAVHNASVCDPYITRS